MYIIDRFEGSWAVIECPDKSMFNLPRNSLPIAAKEGDVIQIKAAIDLEETEKLKKAAEELLGFLKG